MRSPDQSFSGSQLTLFSWIFTGLSLLAVVIGAVVCATARSSDTRFNGILVIAFGSLGIIIGLIVVFVSRQQTKAISSMDKGEGAIWARWRCSPDEAARFLATERKRLTISSKQILIGLLIALGSALVVLPALAVFVRGYSIDFAFMAWSVVVCLAMAGLVWLIASFTYGLELKRTIATATGETLIGEEGLATGGTFWRWRSLNWALRNVAFQAGDPALIEFTFLAGTIPGSALIGHVGRVAYILGEGHSVGSTQKLMKVRVPVPRDREDEARTLVATLKGEPAPERTMLASMPAPAKEAAPNVVPQSSSAALTSKEKLTVMSSSVFILKNEEQLGPFEEAEVRSRIAARTVSPDDLAWHEGLSDWIPLRQIYSDLTGPPPARQAGPPPPPLVRSGPPPIPSSVSAATPVTSSSSVPALAVAKPKSNLKTIASVIGTILLLGIFWLTGVGVKKKGGSWQLKTPRPTATPGQVSTQKQAATPATNAQTAEGVRLYERKQYSDAMRILRPAADSGDAAAQFDVGCMYENGEGVEKNPVEAAKWYQKSATHGNVAAQYNLGRLYLDGSGVQKDYAEALIWFRKAAEHGDSDAQFALGKMYAEGSGVTQDFAQALKWFRASAEQNNPVGQIGLGHLYENGLGVNKDPAQAVNWYRRAAEQGLSIAQYNLGVMYENGSGVPKDLTQARAWYEKAASQDYPDAQAAVARLTKSKHVRSRR